MSAGSPDGEPLAVLVAFEGIVVGSAPIAAMLSGGALGEIAPPCPRPPIEPSLSLAVAAAGLHDRLAGDVPARQIEATQRRRLLAGLGSGALLLPGTIGLLRGLSGFARLALVAEAPLELITPALAGAGIAGFFELAVGGEGRRPMPDPEIHREALRGLGVIPERALAIEASEAGRAAARAAGLHVLGRAEALGLTKFADATQTTPPLVGPRGEDR
jgi:beta-phosphoglucomutase-like phosphatase (HAD superfamily)